MAGSRTIHELAAIITARMPGYERAMTRAAGVTRELAGAWWKAAGDVNAAVNRIGLAVAGIGGFVAKSGIGFLRLQEQATIAFTTVLGDGQKAKAFLDELAKFAERTPFDLPGLSKAASRLLAVGVESKRVIPLMEAIGDATASMGTGSEGINRAVTALQQMAQKGKVTGEEMLQLTEAGLPAWDALAAKLGVDVATAQERVTKGQARFNDLMAALEERAGPAMQRVKGSMDNLSVSFDGLLSTLTDKFSQVSGKIVEPLFNELKGGMDRLLAFTATDEFAAFIDQAREKVSELIAGFKEAAPSILQAAQAFGQMLKPIGEFLLAHPQLLAFFALFKVGSIFGMTQALTSIGGAVLTTVTHFGKLKAVGSALFGPAGLFIVAGAAMFAAADALGVFGQKASSAADQMALLNKQVDQNISLMRKQQQSGLDAADKLEGEARVAALEKQLEQARRRSGVADSVVVANQARQTELQQQGIGVKVGPAFFGSKGAKSRRAEFEHIAGAKESDQRLSDEAAALVEELEAKLAAAREALGRAPSTAEVAGLTGAEPGAAVATARDGIREQLDAARDAAIGRDLPGFTDIRDFLSQEGVTASDVGAFASQLEGATPEMAKGLADQFGAIGQGEFRSADIEMLAQNFAAALNQALTEAGEIEAAKAAAEPAFAAFFDEMAELQERLPAAQFQSFADAAARLREQVNSGQLSADSFSRSMANLRKQTLDAAAAAQEQAMQAKREALLRGDFGADVLKGDVQAAIEAKRLQLAEQRFQQFIDGMIGGVQPLANAAGQVAEGFDNLRGRVDEAGEAFTRAIERIDPRQVSEALNTLGAFFNSQSGAIATLKNNIALLAQQLQLDLPFRKRREVLEDLEAMQSQLAALTRPKPPVIAGTSFGAVPPSIQDPGLAPGAVQIKMEFPNISRITQRDMSEILDAVNLELTRRGSSRFF